MKKKHGNSTHQMSKTKEHATWSKIKIRCMNKNNPSYPRYGGRGITVCDRWLESFENFYEDMGDAPTPDHTIDRIDNNKGYSPDNCRWATRQEQNMNYSRNIPITINGRTMPLAAWVKETDLKYATVYRRLKYAGNTPEEALGFVKIKPRVHDPDKDPRAVMLTVDGVTKSLTRWCEELGLDKACVSQRLNKLKWPVKRALGLDSAHKYRYPTEKGGVHLIEVDGDSKPISQWCDELGLSYEKVHARIFDLKWPIKQALELEPRVRGQKRP